eukprot:735495-Prorocentrum_minimum.AAC.1
MEYSQALSFYWSPVVWVERRGGGESEAGGGLSQLSGGDGGGVRSGSTSHLCHRGRLRVDHKRGGGS